MSRAENNAQGTLPAIAPERSRLRRVAIAGGGTGGHLIPGLAVARQLVTAGVEQIVFIGTERGIETRMVPAAGFQLRLVTVGGLKNLSWRRRLRTLLDLPLAVFGSLRILRQLRAQVVVGIGGYASGPALAAAGLLGIPVVVLEVNARTGLANRLAAPWVRMAAVSFPETGRDFRHFEVTGVPVRDAFFAAPPPRPAGARPRLLVFGGSLGARAINRATVEAARLWQGQNWPVSLLHQTGAADYNEVLGAYREAGVRLSPAGEPTSGEVSGRGSTFTVEAVPFIEEMPAAMGQADLVVCRSGASTLAELAAAGRAALLIPFPAAADNHQWKNAEAYRQAGAAVLLEQKELNGERLAHQVRLLLESGPQRAAMEEAVRRFAHPGAAATIAGLIEQAARK